jgi:hypothetical protein
MNRNILLFTFLLTFLTGYFTCTVDSFGQSFPFGSGQQDPLKEDQILFNGRVWFNHYYDVRGDQFLFSKNYLTGSLSMNGKSYNNIGINYDIYNDEIITKTNLGNLLQLNKEMVDSFTLVSGIDKYRFINIKVDSLQGLKGYVNILYEGKSALIVKYKKEIELLAVDDKFDLFFQTYKIFLIKNGIASQISNKKDLLKVFDEKKAQIKEFVKRNKIKVSKKDPQSIIPVVRYYDTLR